ncbi:MAG TPA: carbonate dehydratase [Sulfurimonas sp.]|nr:carbonate dehydratase [Sulfurimonas sp.]HIM76266.1 carbonate dehydratase [Campylobacterales bacterium]
MNKLSQIFEDNKSWAKDILCADPEFFNSLATQQNPDYLWIGCADSRVPANQIMNLPPGDVFVHRNIANVIVHTDLNALSVIQYAVEVLEVKHIIVCGHYGCGGVKASMDEVQHGLIDNWLRHIKDVQRLHETELKTFTNETQKFDRLCELNVLEQVRNVKNTTIVKNALSNGKELHVHAWIYDIKDGLLKDLKLS